MPIKRDFLRQKTVKTSDKIRLFGVVMTPLKYNVWQWQRTVVYVLLHDCVNVRVCNVHSLHHTGHIGSYKVHTLDILFSLLGNFRAREVFSLKLAAVSRY